MRQLMMKSGMFVVMVFLVGMIAAPSQAVYFVDQESLAFDGAPVMTNAIQAVLRATGTDGAIADPTHAEKRAAPAQRGERETVQNGATRRGGNTMSAKNGEARKALVLAGESDAVRSDAMRYGNEGDGARTRNLRIDSPVL